MVNRVGQQIGNYRLVRLLGSGGFADVYLGQHMRLASKQAAVKILHLTDVDVQTFQKEAETTEQLVHPHIVRLLDFDLEQGTPFLVLDYAPGSSLRARHPKGSIVPLTTVVGYLKEIAPALQYAHDQHILHRDIKPDNMLIGRQGELLLSDFGIAVLTQTGRTSLSSAYGIRGTPYYMAPEMFRGKPEKASDQYALAVVVYEWLCGSVPFSEGNFIQLGYQHSHEPMPPLRGKNPAIFPEVEAVILKALAKEPIQRFGTVLEFAGVLEQAFQSQQTQRSAPMFRAITPTPTTPQITETAPSGYAPPPSPFLEARPPLISGSQSIHIPPPSLSESLNTPGSASSDLSTVAKLPNQMPLPMEAAKSSPRTVWTLKTLSLVGLVFILLISASIGVVSYQNHVNQVNTDTTDRTATSITSLATTVHAPSDVTATAQAATVIAINPNPYPPSTGTLVFYDSLSKPLQWRDQSFSNVGGCHFLNGAYHVSNGASCYATSTNPGEFVFEVQMTTIIGNCGGISDSFNTLIVCQDGTYSYDIYTSTSVNGYPAQPLLKSKAYSPAIKPGLNQTNVVAMVVMSHSITMYVNHQQIDRVDNNNIPSHPGSAAGLSMGYGNGGSQTGEVVFRDARVWALPA